MMLDTLSKKQEALNIALQLIESNGQLTFYLNNANSPFYNPAAQDVGGQLFFLDFQQNPYHLDYETVIEFADKIKTTFPEYDVKWTKTKFIINVDKKLVLREAGPNEIYEDPSKATIMKTCKWHVEVFSLSTQ